MSDFQCDLCEAPAGLLVQREGCIFRCSKCGAPGPATMMEFILGDLRSRYEAVLLSRKSEELYVVAEGVGAEIVAQVLAATAGGQFVWMKPLLIVQGVGACADPTRGVRRQPQRLVVTKSRNSAPEGSECSTR